MYKVSAWLLGITLSGTDRYSQTYSAVVTVCKVGMKAMYIHSMK